MAATWTPVWMVSAEGTQLFEKEASISATSDLVLTRPVGSTRGTRGAQRWSRATFEQYFADSPTKAVARFIEQQQAEIGNYRARIQMCELLLRRAEQLADQVARREALS